MNMKVPEGEKISRERCKDSGLALVLICLIVYQFRPGTGLVPAAILFLVAAMAFPSVFRPFAWVWFGFSALLGTVVSRILLTVIFFCLVLPVGLARRALGSDAMSTRRWKQGAGSVFRIREHRFTPEDLKHPY